MGAANPGVDDVRSPCQPLQYYSKLACRYIYHSALDTRMNDTICVGKIEISKYSNCCLPRLQHTYISLCISVFAFHAFTVGGLRAGLLSAVAM